VAVQNRGVGWSLKLKLKVEVEELLSHEIFNR